MGIKTIIESVDSNLSAGVVESQHNLPNGLMVYTHEADEKVFIYDEFSNDTYGNSMAVSGVYSGTPDGVHNGTDTVYWTASNLSGSNFVFDSTAQAQQGTKSVNGTATVNNNEALFTRGSNIALSGYTTLTGYIYLTSWSLTGTKDLNLRFRSTGVDVGTSVNLSAYINKGILNTWQKFAIPLSAFGAAASATLNELVLRTIDSGGGTPIDFYIDTLQIEQSGSPITFQIPTMYEKDYYVSEMQFSIASTRNSTLASASHQNIVYNKIGDIILTTGIILRMVVDGEVKYSKVLKYHVDFMAIPGLTVQSGGDGTNTWYTYNIRFNQPLLLRGRTRDRMEIVIQDDMSGLNYFKGGIIGTAHSLR